MGKQVGGIDGKISGKTSGRTGGKKGKMVDGKLVR